MSGSSWRSHAAAAIILIGRSWKSCIVTLEATLGGCCNCCETDHGGLMWPPKEPSRAGFKRFQTLAPDNFLPALVPTRSRNELSERVPARAANTGAAPDGAIGAGESGPTVSALVPSRPPLRIEEGLIEVGWGGSLEAEAGVSTGEADAPLDEVSGAVGRKESPGEELIEENERELPSEEMIEDHYAALQAWTEWAKNRGRSLSPSGTAGNEQLERVQGSKTPLVRAKDEQVSEEFSAQGLRPELQHEHAPYSQLFSRLRQSS